MRSFIGFGHLNLQVLREDKPPKTAISNLINSKNYAAWLFEEKLLSIDSQLGAALLIKDRLKTGK